VTERKYSIEFKRTAVKELAELDPSVGRRIKEKIDALADNPRPSGAKKLKGRPAAWRLRVGGYRVIYEIRDAVLVVIVLRTAKRSDVYSD
jgi:mRNA interferase RelE/StbE